MRSLLLASALLLSVHAGAQDDCFSRYINRGRDFLKKEQFNDAIRQFNLARNCPNVSSRQQEEAIDWIEEANQQNIELLEYYREQAYAKRDSALAEAQQARDRAMALLHASGALQANERGDVQDGLALAFRALKLSPETPPPFVLRAFGESAYLSHLETRSGFDREVVFANFAMDEKQYITVSRDSTMRIWNRDGSAAAAAPIRHEGYILSTTLSPSGEQVLTTSTDQTAWVWDLKSKAFTHFIGHEDEVTSGNFSPDGTKVVTCSRDQTAILWGRKGQMMATLKGHKGPVYEAHFSPDGTKVLTRSADQTAKLWNMAGTLLADLDAHSVYLYDASFSADGQFILTAGGDGFLRIWDAEGKLVQSMPHGESLVRSAFFSPPCPEGLECPFGDGQTILALSTDGVVRLWDLQGRLLVNMQSASPAHWAGFSPDGNYILAACEDKVTRLWKTNGQLMAEMEQKAKILSCRFNPRKEQFITISADNTASLWNYKGELLMELNGHKAPILNVQFSPDGNYIISCSEDRTVLLSPTPDVVLASLEAAPPPPLPAEKLVKYGISQ